MQPTPPAITDLERGGGFYALLFVLFWVGVGAAWLIHKAVGFMRQQMEAAGAQNAKQVEMMAKQIDDGRTELAKVVAAFERSLDIHEAQSRPPARRTRK